MRDNPWWIALASRYPSLQLYQVRIQAIFTIRYLVEGVRVAWGKIAVIEDWVLCSNADRAHHNKDKRDRGLRVMFDTCRELPLQQTLSMQSARYVGVKAYRGKVALSGGSRLVWSTWS